MLNLLLGWTLIGWVAAIVWAYANEPEVVAIEPRAAENVATKPCPYCAEPILRAAIKCKHCGSDLSAKTA